MGFNWIFDGLFDDFLLDFGIVGMGCMNACAVGCFFHPENTVFFVITQKIRWQPADNLPFIGVIYPAS
jgi:hypothetical protein